METAVNKKEIKVENSSIGDIQLFAFIESKEDWIATRCGEYGISKSDALISFESSLIGTYYPLEDDGRNILSDVKICTLGELQALSNPPNIVTIVGITPYIENLNEWLDERF